jgi:putative transposase
MDARPKRRSIRLRGYDYSRAGAYFVSICTKDRKCLFSDIENQEMALNDAGRMVDKWYLQLENKFQDIRCGEYIIMPNHFHAIIQNTGPVSVGADLCVCPDDLRVCPDDHRHGRTSGEHIGSPLHRVIQWFKRMTTNEYIRGVKQHGWTPFPGKLWQRNYYEHIVRNEKELTRIREYIRNNPAHWATDRENPFAKANNTLKRQESFKEKQ